MLRRSSVLAAAAALLALTALTGCTPAESDPKSSDDPTDVKAEVVKAPKIGACRVLQPAQLAEASNDTQTVPCTQQHNAETYAVGPFKGKLADAGYDDPQLGAQAYDVCSKAFMKFTGADESLALRSVLSWAWFRPTEDQWTAGARWYRCDVVGGTDRSTQLVDLPKTARGVLLGIPGDRWMSCVKGPSVNDVPPVPCSEPHDWRAVTTIVVGQDKDPYPGDRLVEVQSRDYCSDSVGAWMNYPIDYKYAYTWFHKADWELGNRRSICWAGTKD